VRVKEGGREVAEVTVDEVTVVYAEHDVPAFTEVEVELVGDGDDPDLRRLGRLLRDAGAHKSSGKPKLMRVLDLPAPARPAPNAPLHEQLRHALETQLDALEAHDPGVRFGGDPEDLHQLRVATRRTRALIRATRPLLGDRLVALGEELKLLAGLLGVVRDLDVLLDVDRDSGEELLAAFSAERAMQRTVLVDAMQTPRYTALLDAFRAAIDDLAPLEQRCRADELAERAVRKLRRAADALPAEPSDDELHALRIAAKRARYAAELAALGGRKRTTRAVKALKKLQEVTGEHQDAVVAEDRLRRIARGETSIAAGRLIERERLRKAEMRERYPAALRKALRLGRTAFS
jgi:CHAD domain-containing protein